MKPIAALLLLGLCLLTPAYSAATPPAPATPPSAASPAAEEKQWPIVYHEQAAFHISRGVGGKDARTRAREASAALVAALEAPKPADPSAPDVSIRLDRDSAVLRVRGYVVLALYPVDARAAGFPSLETYARHLEGILSKFVPRQLLRTQLQRIVLKLFLSVFFALLGALCLRQLKHALDRVDCILEAKRSSLRPVTFLSEPLLSGDTLAGILVFALGIGRVVAYTIVVLGTAMAIFGQFEVTRNLLAEAGTRLIEQTFTALQALAGALPRLVLAALLFFLLHLTFRLLGLLVRGVRAGRLHWPGLTRQRVGIGYYVMAIAAVAVFLPHIIAAIFGRFHTPLEWLVIAGFAVAFFALVPPLASYALGALLLWRGDIVAGERVRVGRWSGVVREAHPARLKLEDGHGGQVQVPMLYLAFHPLEKIAPATSLALRCSLRREPGTSLPEETLKTALSDLGETRVELHSLAPAEWDVELVVNAPETPPLSRVVERLERAGVGVLRARRVDDLP